MRLTHHTDLALRLLMYLAVKPSGTATIQEIAERHRISRAHLMKVAQNLGKAGFLDTVRGRGGGLRLARAAKDMRLGDIVRKTEDDFRLVECFEAEQSACVLLPRCRLRSALRRALSAFFEVLDDYTLSDLIKPTTPLRQVLGMSSVGDLRA